MRSRIVMAGVVALAGCGAADVADSRQYAELRDERDALEAELDELDDRLAVSESRLADTEARLASGEQLTADLSELLVMDLMYRVGLDREDSECVAGEFAGNDDVRASYLLLIDPSNTDADPDAGRAAYEAVSVVLGDCGVELASPDDALPSAQAQAALAEVLGEVEVVGTPLPVFQDTAADPAVGMDAPVIVGADYTGAPVTVDAGRDGPTMVVVLAHWCPHCNAEIPKLNQLRDEGRIPDGVRVVAISSALAPDRPNFPPDAWLDDVDWTFPVVADGLDGSGAFVASAAYGTNGVPYAILIDGDGKVTERWSGERDVEQIAAALAGLAGG